MIPPCVAIGVVVGLLAELLEGGWIPIGGGGSWSGVVVPVGVVSVGMLLLLMMFVFVTCTWPLPLKWVPVLAFCVIVGTGMLGRAVGFVCAVGLCISCGVLGIAVVVGIA